jgi:hypothetical protein
MSNLPPISSSSATVMLDLVEYLDRTALLEEGLYRVSGSSTQINELCNLIKSRAPVMNLQFFSFHTIAGALKDILRSHYEPLLTYKLFDEFIMAGDDITALSTIILEIPVSCVFFMVWNASNFYSTNNISESEERANNHTLVD